MLAAEQLHAIVDQLVSRPGHEQVRVLIHELLVQGLGIDRRDIDFELQLPEVRGRADALLGRTVLEFKRDLRRERSAAEEELTRYLGERERQTGDRYVGIATDGALFTPYELRRGRLIALPGFAPSRESPADVLAWLEAVVATSADVEPTPERVRRELGRDSLAHGVARAELEALWSDLRDQPDVRLRRQLWADLLARVYGTSVDDDALFLQHTYLTVVAKTMATRILGVPLPAPHDLLAGTAFADAGIHGAVESDFFDWVLDSPAGVHLVDRIARQVDRFRLADVEADVLKGLYESLVDPAQRHDLGEYYTPDWLAARICETAIERPLEQRVLDPACGSGTFLFHAARRYLAAAEAAGIAPAEAVTTCCDRVLGIDVHPVAVIIARVTYLLALSEERLRARPSIAIPVYLGDSLQWNTRSFLADRVVLIDVPDAPTLAFPFAATRDPVVFDAVVDAMLEFSDQGAAAESYAAWLERHGFDDAMDRNELTGTYTALHALRSAGRDHIWGYVARNQARPIWLSSNEQRPDVLVGNPPWLSYRYMSADMQESFRAEASRLGIWSGARGRVSHQDLSAYFYARGVELYLREGGAVAFVMPYATLSRHHFERFRGGLFPPARTGRTGGGFATTVRFTGAWAFDEHVQPLFPVPSCVLFGRAGDKGPLPATLTAWAGTLPRRDASPDEAAVALAVEERPWPAVGVVEEPSPYRERFRAGAIVFPRLLFLVQPGEPGRLGGDPAAPMVRSRRSRLEKAPWRDLPDLEGRVEAPFLRPLCLGESIAPFRALDAPLAVIPWSERERRLLDREAALAAGYLHLARWLGEVEERWRAHGKRAGEPLVPRLDYFGQLSAQFPVAPVRVVYAASGTLPAAAVVRSARAVVEHKLYWTAASEPEARYLEAILNSDTIRAAVADRQSRGQWGARDFDKVILDLPIPAFDARLPLHRELAAAAEHAEEVAAAVPLRPGLSFVRARALGHIGLHELLDRPAQRLAQDVGCVGAGGLFEAGDECDPVGGHRGGPPS